MKWQNTETPTFSGSAGSLTSGPSVAETLTLVDRDGNVVCEFAKNAAGSYSMTVNGDAAVTGTVTEIITEAELSLSDNTTANASTTKHGFLKKLSNVATEVMVGTGAWATIATILGFTPISSADLPVKATGAEIDTGTDDAKFVTAKAIADSASVGGGSGNITPLSVDSSGEVKGTNLYAKSQSVYMNATGTVSIKAGTGDPEGVVAAGVGSLWIRTDGGTTTTLYVKETGTTTSSGWVAK